MAMKRSFAFFLALGVIGGAGASHAAIITDGDFESDMGTTGGSVGQNNGAAPGWTGTGTIGVLAPSKSNGYPTSGFYAGGNFSQNGTYIGFTQGVGTTYTNLSTTTFLANTTYTVTTLFGNSYESAGGSGTFELVDGTSGTVLATDVVPAPAALTTTAVSFTYDTATTSAGVGDPIRFTYVAGAGGTQAFDNVVVTPTSDSTPEPASMSLLALGGAALVKRRSRIA